MKKKKKNHQALQIVLLLEGTRFPSRRGDNVILLPRRLEASSPSHVEKPSYQHFELIERERARIICIYITKKVFHGTGESPTI